MVIDCATPEATRKALATSIRRNALTVFVISRSALVLVAMFPPSRFECRWWDFVAFLGLLDCYVRHCRLLKLSSADDPDLLGWFGRYLPTPRWDLTVIYVAALMAALGWRGGDARWTCAFAFGLSALAVQIWILPDIKSAWSRMHELAAG